MPEPDERELRVPVIAEDVRIDKVQVVSDRVRVTTAVDTREVVARDVLERGVLRVERVAVERQVDAAPPPREEGDVTIISLVEERLVTEKRLFVVEEVRVTLERTREDVAIPVTLRSTRATVERPLGASSESETNG